MVSGGRLTTSEPARPALSFSLASGAGAFLLFAVQPMIAKFILPWFGGTAGVWSVCLLFFQLLLLAGYAYAYSIMRWLSLRRQVIVHLSLLLLALSWLPVIPAEQWKPTGDHEPALSILLLLAATVGPPYVALAATAPLMQGWFSMLRSGASPYRLYAASNVGALLALLSYPTVVEPQLTRLAQAWSWSAGLVLFLALAAVCGRQVWRAPVSAALAREPAPPSDARWLWLALPAAGSMLLLAVTNIICQDLAVIPFLWVLPLSLYLLSFILCFDHPRWYGRALWIPGLILTTAALLWAIVLPELDLPDGAHPLRWLAARANDLTLAQTIGICLAALFTICMTCHGELYRLRPPANELGTYYLAIAAGGALGSLFVALAAPVLFADFHELFIGLALAAVLTIAVLAQTPGARPHRASLHPAMLFLPILCAMAVGAIYADTRGGTADLVEKVRNFYGVLKVEERGRGNPAEHKLVLYHGGTIHGLQFTAERQRRRPTTYFGDSSGVGLAFAYFPRQENRHVGIVGLGAGTLAAYGRRGDRFRFYEINPAVIRLADKHFTYLKDSPARIQIVPGDARLSLEREAPQAFDILVVDAFSSDAIPTHLLTREAFEIYARHLKPDGVLCFHTSNRYLELGPVVRRAAAQLGYQWLLVADDDGEAHYQLKEVSGIYASDWMLLTRDPAFLRLPPLVKATDDLPKTAAAVALWTDDWTSLLPTFRWEQ